MTLFLALQLPIYCLEFQICLTILFLIVKHIWTAYNTVKNVVQGCKKESGSSSSFTTAWLLWKKSRDYKGMTLFSHQFSHDDDAYIWQR